MKAETVIQLVGFLQAHEIDVVVDGGWGVDALLGRQTRPHDDLDIAIAHRGVPKLRRVLGERGFSEVFRKDSRDCNFVLQDESGNLLDVHSYTFDESGQNIFGVAYLPEHLTGVGTIDGFVVKCIPPECSVKFHTGDDVEKTDFLNVKTLCEKFDLELPDEYKKFVE